MAKELEEHRGRPPIVKKGVAAIVLVTVAALSIWVVIGVIKAVFWTAVVIAAVLAVLWAIKTLVW